MGHTLGGSALSSVSQADITHAWLHFLQWHCYVSEMDSVQKNLTMHSHVLDTFPVFLVGNIQYDFTDYLGTCQTCNSHSCKTKIMWQTKVFATLWFSSGRNLLHLDIILGLKTFPLFKEVKQLKDQYTVVLYCNKWIPRFLKTGRWSSKGFFFQISINQILFV